MISGHNNPIDSLFFEISLEVKIPMKLRLRLLTTKRRKIQRRYCWFCCFGLSFFNNYNNYNNFLLVRMGKLEEDRNTRWK